MHLLSGGFWDTWTLIDTYCMLRAFLSLITFESSDCWMRYLHSICTLWDIITLLNFLKENFLTVERKSLISTSTSIEHSSSSGDFKDRIPTKYDINSEVTCSLGKSLEKVCLTVQEISPNVQLVYLLCIIILLSLLYKCRKNFLRYLRESLNLKSHLSVIIEISYKSTLDVSDFSLLLTGPSSYFSSSRGLLLVSTGAFTSVSLITDACCLKPWFERSKKGPYPSPEVIFLVIFVSSMEFSVSVCPNPPNFRVSSENSSCGQRDWELYRRTIRVGNTSNGPCLRASSWVKQEGHLRELGILRQKYLPYH